MTALLPQAPRTHKLQELRHPTPLQLTVRSVNTRQAVLFTEGDARSYNYPKLSCTPSHPADSPFATRICRHLSSWPDLSLPARRVNDCLELRDCIPSSLADSTLPRDTRTSTQVHTWDPHLLPAPKEGPSDSLPDFLHPFDLSPDQIAE